MYLKIVTSSFKTRKKNRLFFATMDKTGTFGGIVKDQNSNTYVHYKPTANNDDGLAVTGRHREMPNWGHVPPEHPVGPDFDPDFGKMSEEFRNRIRSRQHEEWD